jgi:hypothetical protein
VIDPQSAEPARKKRWCSNYKANLWTDLQRVDLAGDNESKLSKNCKCDLPEWKATLAQGPKAFRDKARDGRDKMMFEYWVKETRMSEERAEKALQLEQPQPLQSSPTVCVANVQPELQPRVHVLPPDSLSDDDLLHDEATQHSDDSP